MTKKISSVNTELLKGFSRGFIDQLWKDIAEHDIRNMGWKSYINDGCKLWGDECVEKFKTVERQEDRLLGYALCLLPVCTRAENFETTVAVIHRSGGGREFETAVVIVAAAACLHWGGKIDITKMLWFKALDKANPLETLSGRGNESHFIKPSIELIKIGYVVHSMLSNLKTAVEASMGLTTILLGVMSVLEVDLKEEIRNSNII